MDDDEFKEQLAMLRKYRNETEWFPLVIFVTFWGSIWFGGVEMEPQIEAVLACIALVGFLVYREVRSLHASFLHAQILAERGLHLRL